MLTKRRVWAALLSGLLAGGAAYADSDFLFTQQDNQQRSFFTLDFGVFGSTEAEVSQTQFLLELDAAAGTARFVRYHQHIDALILPGGYSTGDITVKIVPGSSVGTFNPADGTFQTSELYEIHFTGDLRQFGIESPVVLPSNSDGTVIEEGQGRGRVVLVWDGEGELRNPFDPKNPLRFTYACDVQSVHAHVTRGDLNCDASVNAFDIEPFTLALTDPAGYDAAFLGCDRTLGDFDGSGGVDAFDIDPFIEALFGR